MAKANDTRGPKWVRNWKGPAYPGRTSPTTVIAGLIFVVAGVVFIALAISGVVKLAG